MLFGNTKTSSLVILCDLRYLTGNISSVMTKHMGVQRKLHRFAYLIVQIILCFQSYFSHAIPSLYFSSLSPAPEVAGNTGNTRYHGPPYMGIRHVVLDSRERGHV